MKSAPHLPPPSCVVKAHYLWQTLRFTILILVIAIPASMAMALTTVVWLLPTTIPDSVNAIIGRRDSADKDLKIDSAVLVAARQKLWTVYDKKQKIDNNFYSEQARVATAAVLSSDGWAVMYAPNYVVGAEKNWEAFDYQGISYTVEETVVDPVAKLVYLKFSGRGFRVVQFADWNVANEIYPLWSAMSAPGQGIKLDQSSAYPNGTPHAIWQPPMAAILSEAVSAGSIMVNRDGELVGIANSTNGLIYSWLVENQMNKVLGSDIVEYSAVPWKGYFVYGIIEESNATKKINGFYITDIGVKRSIANVVVGDVVIKIDGRFFDEKNISQTMLSAPAEFVATVLRDGKEIEVRVRKTVVN